jgi:hypothetical protein
MIAMKTYKVVYGMEQDLRFPNLEKGPKPLRYFSSELDVVFLCYRDIWSLVRCAYSDLHRRRIFSQMPAQHVRSVALASSVVLEELESEKVIKLLEHSSLVNLETALAYLPSLETMFVQRTGHSAEVEDDFALIQSRLERVPSADFQIMHHRKTASVDRTWTLGLANKIRETLLHSETGLLKIDISVVEDSGSTPNQASTIDRIVESA